MNIKIATEDVTDSIATSARPSRVAAQGTFETQAQADQQHDQLLRVARIAILMSGAALVGWIPSSIGAANDNAAPAKLSAAQAQAGGASETATDSGHGLSDRPIGPTCAEPGVIASTPEIESTGEFRGGVAVGCGTRSNVAGGTPASSQTKEPQVDAGHARLATRAIYWLRRSSP
jgi:hypothetical protein